MTFVKRVRVDEVVYVLTEKWQTSSLIALQIIIRPESVARDAVAKKDRNRTNGTCLVSQTIRSLVDSGDAEMRTGSQRKREYRLTPKGVARKHELTKRIGALK